MANLITGIFIGLSIAGVIVLLYARWEYRMACLDWHESELARDSQVEISYGDEG